MKQKSKILALVCALIFQTLGLDAQNVTATLQDANDGSPIPFATASLTRKGAAKPSKYVLSTEKGGVTFADVKEGTYDFKAELLGYHVATKEVVVKGSNVAIGVVKMKTDNRQLDAASVSAVGNAIIMKKDTIEYNATSFKTTENDVLEDLLKKLPGVEVSEDGTITANGQTISKITIDGKTFFLDDPQLASKNIPAKVVNKLKVVQKKSDQAAFTGIDDGEEETIIDLSIKPGMMKGAFGNVMGGIGHDLMPDTENMGDHRYQGAAFLGKFTKKQQISLVANANNTNNRGFNDLAGSMMGNMRGGGGGRGRRQGGWGNSNGITTSYMAGLNGAWDLFDDKMDLGGNYLYNHTQKDVGEQSTKTVYQDNDNSLIYNSKGINNTISNGHRFGIRLEHEFSENTSIVFEPQVNFGGGSYLEHSNDTTFRNSYDSRVNEAQVNNTGSNKNVSTSGFFLFRQRLGIPGRTLTAMARYNYSNNVLGGINNNSTTVYDDQGQPSAQTSVNQRFDNQQNSGSIMGRATYTEPIGNNFYLEANYMYQWNRSKSDKQTYDVATGALVESYTNNIVNTYTNQSIGANVMYQNKKFRAQLGFAAKPTKTHNQTTKNAGAIVVDTTMRVWNFAPQAMLWTEFSETSSLRFFYRGNSEQPAVNKLIPIPDNTDPLNVSFGNPFLSPSFSHRINGDYRFNNKKSFSSLNVRLDGNLNQNPVVSALWYGTNGTQYTVPVNGRNTASVNGNVFLNFPIAKSNFSISSNTRIGWTLSNSYVGKNIPDSYIKSDGDLDYSAFFTDYKAGILNFTDNTTNNLNAFERLRLTYRNDNLEIQTQVRTRFNHSWYSISDKADETTTWNSQARLGFNWTWASTGLTLKSEFNYNWYNGYSTPQPSEYILDAEIQKLLCKKKLTLAIKCYDILNQAKNLTVTDESNYHLETRNNTLGRYIIASLTYRFGKFDRSKMRGGHGGPGGPGGFGGPGRGPRF